MEVFLPLEQWGERGVRGERRVMIPRVGLPQHFPANADTCSHLIKGWRHGLVGVSVATEANWTVSSPAEWWCVGRMMVTRLNRRGYEAQGCIGRRTNDTHQDCFCLLALSDSSRTACVMEKNCVEFPPLYIHLNQPFCKTFLINTISWCFLSYSSIRWGRIPVELIQVG